MRTTTTSISNRQRGQALVFTLVFFGVALLGLTFLYKAGKLTGEKMRLQNAADATAYSVSLLEARDLNFTAYINRAMVANEVAVGQMVGLVSWANQLISYQFFLNRYADIITAIPIIGPPLASALRAAGAAFAATGNAARSIVMPFARIGITFLNKLNNLYYYASVAYHAATVAFTLSTIFDVIPQNAPNAELSVFGFMSLIGHVLTYNTQFLTKQVKPTFFAAVVREGRDTFTKGRGWKFGLIADPPGLCYGNCTINPLGFDVGKSFSIGPISVGFRMAMSFLLSLDRVGGSELRYTKEEAKAENFGWSAVDVTALNAALSVSFRAWAELDLGILGSIGASVGGSGRAANNRICFGVELLDVQIFDICAPFPTSIPFAVGTAQTGKPGTNAQTMTTMFSQQPLLTPPGPVPIDAYGGSPSYGTAYDFPGKGAPYTIGSQNVNTKYAGLPAYLDNSTDEPKYGFEAPYFLVGLRDYLSKVNANEVKTAGSLALTDAAANDMLAVIAKSEVYFARPNDLWYFRRSDGYEETGNTFNPFWQARLVETTNDDRMVALAVQQHTGWVSGFNAMVTMAKDFPSFLQSIGLL